MTETDNVEFTVPDPWGDLPAYALNALSAEERARVDELLESSPEARAELCEYMEAAENLSFFASGASPAGDVRSRLLAQADRDIRLIDVALEEARSVRPGRITTIRSILRPARMVYAGTAAALVSVLSMAIFFSMENARLDSEVDVLKTEVSSQFVQVAELREVVEDTTAQFASQDAEVARLTAVNAGLNEALKNQQWLTYVTQNQEFRVPNYFVGNSDAPGANGTLAVNDDSEAVFLAFGLPLAPDGFEYMLSLVRDSVPEAVATFQVNEAGMARVNFDLPENTWQFDSAIVTLESIASQGSIYSGTEVMTVSDTPR